ncbi:hypothetical protein [Methylobacterium sp. WSM2598]|uniref:hypothetical protein n=1 Tax=Methylobacterium sp. WSM2598 TaxID=398261 RepID=UPI0018E051ED|nr:hypothetical protein [Methylobacterium sp. WSM2598]
MTNSHAGAAVLMLSLLAGAAGGTGRAEPRVVLAQGSVTIPSDAQLERMQREAISTPPLDVSEGAQGGGQGARTRQIERRDHGGDRRRPKHDGACDDC